MVTSRSGKYGVVSELIPTRRFSRPPLKDIDQKVSNNSRARQRGVGILVGEVVTLRQDFGRSRLLQLQDGFGPSVPAHHDFGTMALLLKGCRPRLGLIKMTSHDISATQEHLLAVLTRTTKCHYKLRTTLQKY